MGFSVQIIEKPPLQNRALLPLLLIFSLSAAVLQPEPVRAIASPFLSAQQVDFADITPFTRWTAVMPRYAEQNTVALNTCLGEGCLNKQWEILLKGLAGASRSEQVEAVNRFFNEMPYITDEDNYGVTDYWQTPYELMERGGDCEDYVIAKYVSLKRLGVPENALRILVVRDDTLGGTVHALLEVKVDGEALILDNQTTQVVSAKQLYHYRPVYAINESKWWSYK